MVEVAALSRGPGSRRRLGGEASGRDDEFVEGFLAGFSQSTAACYRRDLKSLRDFFASRGKDLLSARAGELRTYASSLEAAGEDLATIRRQPAAASSLYRFLVSEGLPDRSPLAWVRHPSGGAAPRLGLEPDSLRRLWESMVRRLGEEAGVEVYPHLLRHTHVTVALEAGIGLLEVAASAGHRDPRTTAAYVEALRAVAAVLSQAGPTASDRADS